MFGFDAAKARQPLVGLHRFRGLPESSHFITPPCREAIVYALEGLDKTATPDGPPYNLDFLEILTELSSRLLEVDRSGNKGLLVYLNDQLSPDLPLDDDEWQALVIYRASLGGKRSEDSNIIEKAKDKAANVPKQS